MESGLKAGVVLGCVLGFIGIVLGGIGIGIATYSACKLGSL